MIFDSGDFMVKDSLENIELLVKYGENFKSAVDFLKSIELDKLIPGKYDIDGDKAFAFFCNVDLADASCAKLETHKKYADIQVVTDGCEGMEYAPANLLTVKEEYNSEGDIAFYEDSEETQMLKVSAGEFVLFLPDDAHKPNCIVGNGKTSKKLIVKVGLF